jgi:hypothetical protein
MGQAFDRDGNVLGEAEGDTRREVLDQLERMHPTAAEIRIKAMKEKVEAVERTQQAGKAVQEPLMQFFRYAHLPAQLQTGSRPFCDLAVHLEATYPRNPERTVALRKLLEAKDAAVRSLLYES